MIDPSLYEGREQTLIKHFIFGKYIERFAIIIGFRWNSITYVDGFSGPWNQKSNKCEDSSFAIALDELRKARTLHGEKGRTLKLRCFFIEKDPKAFGKLQEFAQKQEDVEIRVANSDFEEGVPKIVDFIKEGGKSTFPFVFIDPKGWSGFALRTITPILRLNPGEVLINFQTGFIKRFIELESTRADFNALFGSETFRDFIAGLKREEREDAAVLEYCRSVKAAAGFEYVCSAVVPRPEAEKTHFHLVYGTRDLRGIDVFKDAEKRSVSVIEQVRPAAQKKRREKRSGELEFDFMAAPAPSSHIAALRARHVARAKLAVETLVRSEGRVLYDRAWAEALVHPLVWESDLKDWIKKWEGTWLEVEGLKRKESVPKLKKGHYLVLRSDS